MYIKLPLSPAIESHSSTSVFIMSVFEYELPFVFSVNSRRQHRPLLIHQNAETIQSMQILLLHWGRFWLDNDLGPAY